MCAISINWYDWAWSESEGKRPKPTPLPHMLLWLFYLSYSTGVFIEDHTFHFEKTISQVEAITHCE